MKKTLHDLRADGWLFEWEPALGFVTGKHPAGGKFSACEVVAPSHWEISHEIGRTIAAALNAEPIEPVMVTCEVCGIHAASRRMGELRVCPDCITPGQPTDVLDEPLGPPPPTQADNPTQQRHDLARQILLTILHGAYRRPGPTYPTATALLDVPSLAWDMAHRFYEHAPDE